MKTYMTNPWAETGRIIPFNLRLDCDWIQLGHLDAPMLLVDGHAVQHKSGNDEPYTLPQLALREV